MLVYAHGSVLHASDHKSLRNKPVILLSHSYRKTNYYRMSTIHLNEVPEV